MTDEKEPEVWEDWQKKRIFVHEVAGKYDEYFQAPSGTRPESSRANRNPGRTGPCSSTSI